MESAPRLPTRANDVCKHGSAGNALRPSLWERDPEIPVIHPQKRMSHRSHLLKEMGHLSLQRRDRLKKGLKWASPATSWSTTEKPTQILLKGEGHPLLLLCGTTEWCTDLRRCSVPWQHQERRFFFLLPSLLSALHLLLLSFYLTNTFINEFGPSVPQAHKIISFFTPPFRCLIPISHMFFHDKEHLLLWVCTVPSKQGPPSAELVGYGKKMSIKKLRQHEDSAERSPRSDFMPVPFRLVSDPLIIFTE